MGFTESVLVFIAMFYAFKHIWAIAHDTTHWNKHVIKAGLGLAFIVGLGMFLTLSGVLEMGFDLSSVVMIGYMVTWGLVALVWSFFAVARGDFSI